MKIQSLKISKGFDIADLRKQKEVFKAHSQKGREVEGDISPRN